MPKLLEVIVTSVDEALDAQAGGADRLELVRALDQGGLTPSLAVVEAVMACASVPVRVMLRPSATMSIGSGEELDTLLADASAFAKLPISGLVAGFVRGDGIDSGTLRKIANAGSSLPITFHRAFEGVHSPESSLQDIRALNSVDRLLIRAAGRFSLPYLAGLQSTAGPQVQIITGTGLSKETLTELAEFPALCEVHVGRAAREPATTDGKVSSSKIAAIKRVIS